MKLFNIFLLISFSIGAFGFDHDHKTFDLILKKNVSFKGKQSFVDYKNIKRNASQLNRYLSGLSSVSKKEFNTFSHDQRLSFLINAYNAFTIKIIIDNYPLKSIKDIGSIFRSTWKRKFFTILGEKSHLDNVEHNLIRKNFNEPRIHFAVNCASVGCPPLQAEAFTAKRLERMLEKGAVDFLADKNKNRIQGDTLYLSPIFKWYGEDFEKKFGSLENYIASYLTKDTTLIKRIESGDLSTRWTVYDWSLNE